VVLSLSSLLLLCVGAVNAALSRLCCSRGVVGAEDNFVICLGGVESCSYIYLFHQPKFFQSELFVRFDFLNGRQGS
jgi:hypothetical protein